jgi:hypothetical protein
MQIPAEIQPASPAVSMPGLADPHTAGASAATPSASPDLSGYKLIRRNGAVVAFEPNKIAVALTKAFIAVHGGQAAGSARVRETVETLTRNVVGKRGQARINLRHDTACPAAPASILMVSRCTSCSTGTTANLASLAKKTIKPISIGWAKRSRKSAVHYMPMPSWPTMSTS